MRKTIMILVTLAVSPVARASNPVAEMNARAVVQHKADQTRAEVARLAKVERSQALALKGALRLLKGGLITEPALMSQNQDASTVLDYMKAKGFGKKDGIVVVDRAPWRNRGYLSQRDLSGSLVLTPSGPRIVDMGAGHRNYYPNVDSLFWGTPNRVSAPFVRMRAVTENDLRELGLTDEASVHRAVAGATLRVANGTHEVVRSIDERGLLDRIFDQRD